MNNNQEGRKPLLFSEIVKKSSVNQTRSEAHQRNHQQNEPRAAPANDLRSNVVVEDPSLHAQGLPKVGRIYRLRQSVNEAIGSSPSLRHVPFPSLSSTTSRSSSSRHKGPARRPCLLLNYGIVQSGILLMTTFSKKDPMSRTDMVLPSLSREELREHILPIHPTEPLDARRSVILQHEQSHCSASFTRKRQEQNHYLLLIPVTVMSSIDWGRPCADFFPVHEMVYIAETVTQLQLRSMTNSFFQSVQVDDGSVTASSLPIPRRALTWEAHGTNSDDEVSTGSSVLLIGSRSEPPLNTAMIQLSLNEKISDWFKKNDFADLF